MTITFAPAASERPRQLVLYEEAVSSFGPALSRLIRSYERDDDKRQDLRQEIHLALWRSFARFDERCSLRTWTYRVAHNVASSFVLRHRRSRAGDSVSIDEIDDLADDAKPDETADRNIMVERLRGLIARVLPRGTRARTIALRRRAVLDALRGDGCGADSLRDRHRDRGTWCDDPRDHRRSDVHGAHLAVDHRKPQDGAGLPAED
jgi:RNA polymerase sigma factor (sigma-70 family)